MNNRVIAIGDLQGCYDSLMLLLEDLNYDDRKDQLWFTGDLVNRGPQSLTVLRFVKNLGSKAVTVLGNHDLHCLAVAAGAQTQKKKDTLNEILAAPDREDLLDWLRHQPLLHHSASIGFSLAHAGIYPAWSMADAQRLAREAENMLCSESVTEFYQHMYGNHPEKWNEQLQGWERLRFIVNSFTRMRFIDENGNLELKHKGPPGSQPPNLLPWFLWPGRVEHFSPVIFGHWSALGIYSKHNVFSLDTGCLWGGSLTALVIDDNPRHHSVPCREYLELS